MAIRAGSTTSPGTRAREFGEGVGQAGAAGVPGVAGIDGFADQVRDGVGEREVHLRDERGEDGSDRPPSSHCAASAASQRERSNSALLDGGRIGGGRGESPSQGTVATRPERIRVAMPGLALSVREETFAA